MRTQSLSTMIHGRFLIELSPVVARKQDTPPRAFVPKGLPKLRMYSIPEESCDPNIPRQDEISSPIYNSEDVFINRKRKLGRGGFGTVFESQVLGSTTVYAAKEIKIRHHQRVQDVTEESEVQYKLAKNSNFFPKVICVSFKRDYVTIVMEKVPLTLLDAIHRGWNSEAIVKDCILQLLRGAKEMHDQKIAHMDIKPENIGIAIKPDGGLSFKYLDFSSDTTCHLDEECMAVPRGSTFEYVSPESLYNLDEGKIRCDISDTWSIGCTILEMVTGIIPWKGLLRGQIIAQLCAGNHPEVPSDIPVTIKDFILDCFKKSNERLSPKELLTKYHDVFA